MVESILDVRSLIFFSSRSDSFSHDLAVECLRKFVNKFNYTGILVRSCLLLDVMLDLFLEFFSTLGSLNERDGSLYDDTSYALRIGSTGNGTLEYIRKLHNDILDLEGSDSVAGRLNDIVRASDI